MKSPLQPLLHSTPLDSTACKPGDGATCLDRIAQGFYGSCRELGFHYSRFSCWTSYMDGKGQPQVWYSSNFSNFPNTWETLYEQQQWYLFDPVVHRVHQKPDNQPVAYGTWDSAAQQACEQPIGADDEQQHSRRQIEQLFEQARLHGLYNGCYFTCQDGVRHAAISVASKQALPAPAIQHGLWQSLFAISHLVMASVALTRRCDQCNVAVRTGGLPALNLSPSQREILQLFIQHPRAAAGEIAAHLGKSAEAINFHLKALRRNLGLPGMSGYALARFAREHNLA